MILAAQQEGYKQQKLRNCCCATISNYIKVVNVVVLSCLTTVLLLIPPTTTLIVTAFTQQQQQQRIPYIVGSLKRQQQQLLLRHSTNKLVDWNEEIDNDIIIQQQDPTSTTTRRNFIQRSIVITTTTTMGGFSFHPDMSFGSSSDDMKSGSVAVIGANGKTGMEVVYALINVGITPISMTRSGNNPFERNRKLSDTIKDKIIHYPNPVNVVSIDSLRDAFQTIVQQQQQQSTTTIVPPILGIIFCASSSPAGGTPNEVDNIGVQNTAIIAKEIKAKLVVLSALAVDRPNSQSYQITNTLGGRLNGIMDAKLAGENSVRNILNASGKNNYIILRSGVLLNGIGRNGVQDIEINQGDMIGGGLSRDELAAVAVGAMQKMISSSSKDGGGGITVEVYRTNTRTKLQKEFPDFSGMEQHATNTYSELFDSVVYD